jgi:hypothetical protein
MATETILENLRELNKDLDWEELQVGEQYLYEESYYLKGIFTIIEDLSTEEESRFRIRMDEFLGSIAKYEPGAVVEFEVARDRHDRTYDYISKISFQHVGSDGHYMYVREK